MHVITGGAYNGKSAWVKQFYKIELINETVHWVNLYDGEKIPQDIKSLNGLVIFEGIEQWVMQCLNQKMDMSNVRQYGRSKIEKWLTWENECAEHKLIIIATDISKGIVPIDETLRKWRDVTGWFYQDLFKRAERIDLIWYGIAKQLKLGGLNDEDLYENR